MKETLLWTCVSLYLFSIYRHPLILVATLTLQSLPTIFLINNKSSSTWMSYLMFLIFLGGLLIIFVYLSAMIPNEIFSPPLWKSSSMLIILSFLGVSVMNLNKMNINSQTNYTVMNFSSSFYQNILLFMLLYLLMCLSSTMFLTSKYKTPMKTNFYG